MVLGIEAPNLVAWLQVPTSLSLDYIEAAATTCTPRKTQGHAVKFFNPMVDYQYIHRAIQFNGWFVEERR